MNKALVDKILSMPLAAKILFAVNVGALLFALTMEFALRVLPCELCLWQRVPYASVAVLSLLCLFWKPLGNKGVALVLGLCAVIYLAGMGTAFYHSGVERHWWTGLSSCTAEQITGATEEEIRLALLAADDVPCDVISWSIFGLSMANFNVVGSLGLAVFSALVAYRQKKKS